MTAARHQTVIVLAPSHDRGAVAVARTAAARRGAGAVHLVTPSELAGARGWTHAVDARGGVTGDVVLRSGTVLAPDAIGACSTGASSWRRPRSHERSRGSATTPRPRCTPSWSAGWKAWAAR